MRRRRTAHGRSHARPVSRKCGSFLANLALLSSQFCTRIGQVGGVRNPCSIMLPTPLESNHPSPFPDDLPTPARPGMLDHGRRHPFEVACAHFGNPRSENMIPSGSWSCRWWVYSSTTVGNCAWQNPHSCSNPSRVRLAQTAHGKAWSGWNTHFLDRGKVMRSGSRPSSPAAPTATAPLPAWPAPLPCTACDRSGAVRGCGAWWAMVGYSVRRVSYGHNA